MLRRTERPSSSELCDQKSTFQWGRVGLAYSRNLSLIPVQHLEERADTLENVAYYQYLAALQSRSAGQFRRSMSEALSHQRQASALFKKNGTKSLAKLARSAAAEAFLAFWLAANREQRKDLLERAWNLAIKAFQLFYPSKRFHEYAETYNRLSFAAALSVEFDGNLKSRLRRLSVAAKHGRIALAIWRSMGDKTEIVKTLIRVSIFLDGLSDDLSDRIKQRDCRREARRLWDEAFRVSRTVALHEITHPLHGSPVLDPTKNLKICSEALKVVTPQKDNFALGRLMEYLAKWTFYAAESSSGGDPAVSKKMHLGALHYAEEASRYYDVVNFTSPIAGVLWVHSPYADHFNSLAKYERDPGKRTLLEEKALRSTPELIRLVKRRGSPRVLFYALYTASKLEVNVSEKEKNPQRRKRLLQSALSHTMETLPMVNQIFGSSSWNRAAAIRGLADVQSKLAELENSQRKRTALLLEAIRNQEKSLRFAVSFIRGLEQSGYHYSSERIGQLYDGLGGLLLRLESITRNKQNARKAAWAYSTAAEWYERIPRYDRAAQSYWKSAETYDQLQAYTLAAECFAFASKAYMKLGRLVKTLKEHSKNYELYLRAWTKIEIARSLHVRQQFASAAESYRLAARLHKSTKRWNQLASYYLAWSWLESGEKFSRRGLHKSAIDAFRRAAAGFQAAKISIRDQLPMLDRPEERMRMEKLANSSRDSYCEARTSLEEAMMAESQEDYHACLEKYRLSSQKFRELSGLSQSEEDRREASFLSNLCEAWRLASKAELEDSTEPLEKARSLFERAKTLGPNEKSLKLGSGHKAFCEALIASRKFANTLDPEFHESASRQLELAERYYQDSGFATAGHHARARRLLLNASLQLSKANNEPDERKKAALYQLADVLLRESAIEFLRARQPIRRREALRLLEKAQIESRTSLKLLETLKAATAPSTNAAFYTPIQGEEKAVGLERFDHPDVEARVVNVTRGVGINGDVELEIEISNLGAQPVRVLRLDDIIPEGTDLTKAPESWKDQGRSLTDGGQMISPTKTETLRLYFRPRADGLLRIQPRVVFIDENGSRWERFMNARVVPTSRIVEFLASSYVKDSASRLGLEHCGWKTMMEIVKRLHIPKSHVYGEPRYGRAFGRQLDLLVKGSLVEYRIFPRERGRGGNITKVRVQLRNEDVRKYIEELTSGQENAVGILHA
jgi:tetratricopeptide (TPR) repeat protein